MTKRSTAWAAAVVAGLVAAAGVLRGRRRPEAAVLFDSVGQKDAPGPVAVAANPGSGDGGALDLGDLRVRTLVDGEDLTEVLEELAGEGAGVLGIAGGDGSVGCAAQVAAERRTALWVVPGGTLNHFARALGTPTVQDALDALASGRSAIVDLAEVDGTVFVNNASIGVYGDLVRRRERLERHMPKRIALLIAAVRTMSSAEPLEIEVDGRHERAFLVFVGNNAYSGLGLTGRASLQTGLLDVRVLRARGPVPVLGVLARIVIGWLPRSQWLHQSLRREVVVRVPEGTPLAHDGEVEEASGELRFSSRPGAVRVVVGTPPG